MSITGIGSRSTLAVQALVDMRHQLDDLQRQLGTGKKSDTYAGIGIDRGFVVGLRSHVSSIGAYDDTISNVGVRMNLAQTALGRLDEISHAVKSSAFTAPSVQGNGSTISQSLAYSELDETLSLLNTRAGDRYLFSGRAADQPAVETLDHIMNGDGVRAGFKQIVLERNQADLGGVGGHGRLDITGPGLTSVQIAEDAVSPFGFKLASVTSTLTGATVTGPAGSPAVASVDLVTNPNTGETIQFRFNLPDGTSESITLTATNSATPGPNEFSIAPSSDLTADNLEAALTAAVDKLADTSLTAASAVAASKDFFGNPPQRVAGPAFTTATALVAGTSTDTVNWYTGENGPDPARGTATARIDPTITVSYGLRANEEGLRWVVQNMAALAAVTFSPTDPNAIERAVALNQRIGQNLDVPAGTQTIEDIETEIAGAQTALETATDRHRQTKAALSDLLTQIEGVPTEEVAAQILALQTRLQASLQTTSLLYKTSLVNYI
jgi:flagellin-like hook-associated protein FlgL